MKKSKVQHNYTLAKGYAIITFYYGVLHCWALAEKRETSTNGDHNVLFILRAACFHCVWPVMSSGTKLCLL